MLDSIGESVVRTTTHADNNLVMESKDEKNGIFFEEYDKK